MPLKILIVEDEALIAEELSLILSKEGYQVVGKSYDGIQALDMISSRSPELVVLDIELNSAISGFDIARILNEKYKIPFLFITSYADKITLEQAGSLLPLGYITKPFKKKDIIAAVGMIAYRLSHQPESRLKDFHTLNQQLAEPLTPKEYDLLADLSKGLSNEELTRKHFISLNTVKTHLRRVFNKLDVTSRTNAILKILK